jgi:hypothetical protein
VITYTDLPARMESLPRDQVGHPVPWFVAWPDGKPDFRLIGPGKIRKAVRYSLCWVCGGGLAPGGERAWLIGPMCLITLTTAEPPCHEDCATWSARNCPFLATPGMTRRERHIPQEARNPAGIMIRRNPGVALVAVTGYRDWRAERHPDGSLFKLGAPRRTLWYAEGRPATRAEVAASIGSGLPILRETAETDGPEAVAELDAMHAAALKFLPPEAVPASA